MTPQTLPQKLREVSETFSDKPFQFYKKKNSIPSSELNPYLTRTYGEYWNEVSQVGAGLLSLGITRGYHAAIVADNCKDWLVIDQALLGIGAIDIPKGADSTKEEICYILQHGDCNLAIAEDSIQLEKILASLSGTKNTNLISSLKLVIVLDNSLQIRRKGPSSLRLLNYSEVVALGKDTLIKMPHIFNDQVNQGTEDDLATIIYTSGTTGEPKGVMIAHRAYLFQIERALEVLEVRSIHTVLSVLPIWHSYERAIEYIVMGAGAAIGYSKPIGKIMLDDMTALRPAWMISVPRIWESVRAAIYRNLKNQNTIKQKTFDFFVSVGSRYADLKDQFLCRWPRYKPHWDWVTQCCVFLPLVVLFIFKRIGDIIVFRKLKNLLGGRFVAGVSGGGALPAHVDQFFRAVGIKVLEGYGLTEAAPVLAVRPQKRPVPHTIGPLFKHVEYKIVDEESGQILGIGQKGELWVRSPQVMLGYYKRPELTANVLVDGWLNTGDLVTVSTKGEIKIIGRSKDTIVLRGGENIEPEPIENKLLQSEFIEQVMIVGQDQKYLAALIVPNYDLLEQFAQERQITYLDRDELLDNSQIEEYVHEVIQHLVNPRTGFKAFERVFKFKLLQTPFEIGVEMTQSLKLKRNVIAKKYAKTIDSLFESSVHE